MFLFEPHMQFSRAPRKHPRWADAGRFQGPIRGSSSYAGVQWPPNVLAPRAGFMEDSFQGPVGLGMTHVRYTLLLSFASAPPQIIRCQVLEAGDPCSRRSQGPSPTRPGLVMQPLPGKSVPQGSPGLQNHPSPTPRLQLTDYVQDTAPRIWA